MTLALRFLRRTLLIAALLFVIFAFPFRTLHAQNPWNGKVVLQAYWWNYYNNNYANGWYNYLSDLAPRLREMGIDAVWIPPSSKGGSGTGDNGYGTFDHYDLGDKYQKGNVRTRLGSKDEYLRMVAVMHANGIEVIQDVVLNHTFGAGSTTGAGGIDPTAWNNQYKNFRYVSYLTPATTEDATNYLARSGRWSKNWQNFNPNPAHPYSGAEWDNELFGPDNSYYTGTSGLSSNATFNPAQNSLYMRDQARNWMVWLKKQTGIDGFRLDAVKHFPHYVTQDILYNVKYSASWANGGANMFAVGEYVGSGTDMDAWINNVKTSNGGSEDLVGTFDFGLRSGIYDMVSGGGNFDIGSIPGRQQGNRYRTVPFVNNHDTFRPQLGSTGNYTGWNTSEELAPHIDPFDARLEAAHAVACAVDGSPQIFFEDLFNIGSTGLRYTHSPTSTTDLPVRDAIANIIWCHQKLNFKKGSYKVRAQAQDLLIIERGYKSGPENSYAVIGINDNFSTWQSATVQTDFGANRQLHDYSGANSGDIWTDSQGRATFWVPPCNGSNLRRGYAIWGPAGISGGFAPATRTTTQEWELANDLGDSHASSLLQGGALPAGSTALRTAGKVFAEGGKSITVNLYPTVTTRSHTLNVYNAAGSIVSTVANTGSLTLSYTPSSTGWYSMKARHTSSSSAPLETVWIKAAYTAPRTASTASFPARAVSGGTTKTGVAAASDEMNEEITETESASIQVPQQTRLLGNYPNPFNPATTIRFELSQASAVKVVVYNGLGQSVATLQDGVLGAGAYTRQFNAQLLPSGLYFVRMTTEQSAFTQKIMLVK